MVVFGAYYCVHGNLQAGAYIAFISYNAMLVWPIRQLGRMISEMSKAGVSIDRVAYIMHSPVEQGTHPALLKKQGYYYELYSKQYEEETVSRIFS